MAACLTLSRSFKMDCKSNSGDWTFYCYVEVNYCASRPCWVLILLSSVSRLLIMWTCCWPAMMTRMAQVSTTWTTCLLWSRPPSPPTATAPSSRSLYLTSTTNQVSQRDVWMIWCCRGWTTDMAVRSHGLWSRLTAVWGPLLNRLVGLTWIPELWVETRSVVC